MVEVVLRCIRLMASESRGRWVLVCVLAVLVAGTEAVGALLVLVLLGMVTGDSDSLELPLLGDVRGFLPGWEQRDLFLISSAFIAAFFLGRALLVVVQVYVQNRMVENTGAGISARLVRGYLAMPYTFHLQRNSSQLIRNAQESVQVITTEAMVPLLQLFSEAALASALIAVLLVTAPVATLLALLALGPLVAVLMSVVQPRIKQYGRTGQDMSKATLQLLQQSLHGVREIKVIGRERFFERQYVRSRRELARVRYLRNAMKVIPRVGVETAMIFVVIGFFAVTVLTQGTASGALPILGLFAYAALRLKPPLNVILAAANSLRFAGAAIDDVRGDLEAADEVRTVAGSRKDGPPLPFTQELRLTQVRYRYPDAPEDVLCGIDVTVPRGSSLGVVGPTGGGKSTLLDVVMGLLEPTGGSVRVDGVSIQEDLAGWHRNLGVVSQSVFLVDDTVRRNIGLGIDDEEIDEERLEAAIRMAQLDAVVDAMPLGLDTIVGERGIRLSGGQRQRVAIARALYRDPSVLIFDEATSALDNRTEADLLKTIGELHGSRTLITVAHRLTTVRDADQILVIARGRVVDRGTFDELAQRSDVFRGLTSTEQGGT